MATETPAPPARLKTRYLEEIRPALIGTYKIFTGDSYLFLVFHSFSLPGYFKIACSLRPFIVG